MPANDGEISLELFAAEVQRTHVRSDDIFTKISIHLDDHGANQARLRHDEVIAFDPDLDAAGKLADVSQLLPGDSLHAVAPRTAGAS